MMARIAASSRARARPTKSPSLNAGCIAGPHGVLVKSLDVPRGKKVPNFVAARCALLPRDFLVPLCRSGIAALGQLRSVSASIRQLGVVVLCRRLRICLLALKTGKYLSDTA